MSDTTTSTLTKEGPNMRLFWGSFIALVATAFGFILRALVIGDWQVEYGFSGTQVGTLTGVGLWPFAISIVLFSLVIDRLGYKNVLYFAFGAHIVSAILTISAAGMDPETGYTMLYWGTFIVALGNGAIEAAVNPIVATMFSENKTKWLNILHAGWAAGLVLGGILALMMGAGIAADGSLVSGWFGAGSLWQWKIGLILLPTLAYGYMLFSETFPVQERVKAGVSYKDMLKELGVGGAAIIITLMVLNLGEVFGWPLGASLTVIAALTIAYGYFVPALGQPLLIVLMLIMIPLAITELGTDSWISELMGPAMDSIGLQAGWVLVYTSFIMMVLRFFAGSIVHRISPLGLLALSSLIAAIGLYTLSGASAAGLAILAGATIFAFGKAFFWPTMLGVVAEQFPRGGALTLNVIAGVGMIAAGVVGTVLIGNIQDRALQAEVTKVNSEAVTQYFTEPQSSIFGDYNKLNAEALAASGSEEIKAQVETATENSKTSALATVAWFPIVMFIGFALLIAYFNTRGGYKAKSLVEEKSAEVKA